MATDRVEKLKQEKGRALVRALHLSELEAAGEARSQALTEAEAQLDRIARLLPNALEAGISVAEIARTTNVSRPTLYELRARYAGPAGDLDLAVLQSVIAGHANTVAELVDRLGRPADEIRPVVDRFLSGDLFFGEPAEVGPNEWEGHLHVTEKGFGALEEWTFEDAEEEALG